MCQSAVVDGKYTGQVQELADMLGVKPDELVWSDQYDTGPIEGGYKFCLCPIDLEGTAKKFGYEYEYDPIEWVGTLTKKSKT